MPHQPDPMEAELERLEAEIDAQNESLDALRATVAASAADELLTIPRDELDAIAAACVPQRAPQRPPNDTAIRC